MKYSTPHGRTVGSGNEAAGAIPVLLLALGLFVTSAPAGTSTWDGGSMGNTDASDVLEKLSLTTESETVSFGDDVRPNSDSATALPLSTPRIKSNRNATTFGPADHFDFRRILAGIPSPLPQDANPTVKSGSLSIAANVLGDAGGTMRHATCAVLVGDTSVGSFSSLLTGWEKAESKKQKVETGFQLSQFQLSTFPMIDSAGGILDANNPDEHSIGALSLTANSTFDLPAGDRTASPRLVPGSTTGATLRINAGSDAADASCPHDNIFITADAATSGTLGQIEFKSDAPGATLSGRLIVPVPEPTTVALGVFGAVVVMFGMGRLLGKVEMRKAESRNPKSGQSHFCFLPSAFCFLFLTGQVSGPDTSHLAPDTILLSDKT